MLFDGSSTVIDVITVDTRPHSYNVAHGIIWLCYFCTFSVIYQTQTRRAIPKKVLVEVNIDDLFFLANLDVF